MRKKNEWISFQQVFNFLVQVLRRNNWIVIKIENNIIYTSLGENKYQYELEVSKYDPSTFGKNKMMLFPDYEGIGWTHNEECYYISFSHRRYYIEDPEEVKDFEDTLRRFRKEVDEPLKIGICSLEYHSFLGKQYKESV